MSTSYRHKRIPGVETLKPTEIVNGKKYYGFEGCFSEEDLHSHDKQLWEWEDQEIESSDMFKEDELEQRKIQEKEEYRKNTFICPWYWRNKFTGKLLYKTRDEYEEAYKAAKARGRVDCILLSNPELHDIQEKKDEDDRKERERKKWETDIDNEMYELGMIA